MLIIVVYVINSNFIRLRVFMYKHLLTCIATLVTQLSSQILRSMERYVPKDLIEINIIKDIIEVK